MVRHKHYQCGCVFGKFRCDEARLLWRQAHEAYDNRDYDGYEIFKDIYYNHFREQEDSNYERIVEKEQR